MSVYVCLCVFMYVCLCVSVSLSVDILELYSPRSTVAAVPYNNRTLPVYSQIMRPALYGLIRLKSVSHCYYEYE